MFEVIVILGAAGFWCMWAAVLTHYWSVSGNDENYRPNTSGSYHF